MLKFITTTQLQKEIGKISTEIQENHFIVNNHGQPKFIILPYFEGCMELMEDFIEDYEIHINKPKIQKSIDESIASGISDLKI